MDNNEFSREKAEAKKKLALFIAGGITLLIFIGWLFYFLNKAKSVMENSQDEVALFEKLKQNTGEAFGNIGAVFGDLGKKVSSFGEFYSHSVSTSTATTTATTTIK